MRSKPRKKFDESKGVSEVVGTIIMLGITVTLFVTIIYFVQQVPTPQERVHVDLDGRLTTAGTITITHSGGQAIMEYDTKIVVYYSVGNSRNIDIFDTRDGGVANEWNIGDTWTVTDPNYATSDNVDILVINDQLDQVIWEATLTVEVGEESPTIKERFTSPSPVGQGQYFKAVAKIIDTDGDLDPSSLYVNMSSLGLGEYDLFDTNNDGFYNTSRIQMPVGTAVGKYTVKVYASDLAVPAHTEWANLEVTVARGTAPVFEDVWYESSYDPSNMTRNLDPLGWGEYFALKAQITDVQDDIDPSRVTVDLASLGMGTFNMTEIESDVFSTSIASPLRMPSNLFGVTYTVPIHAYDDADHYSRYDLVLKVSSAPEIRKMWYEWDVDGDGVMEETTDPLPWREDFELWAYVIDPDGDLSGVTLDVSELGITPAFATMSEDVAGSGLFSYSGTVPGRTVLAEGYHTVYVTADDANGNSTTGQLGIRISSGPVFREVWKESDPGTGWSANDHPLVWGDSFTINSIVSDPDNNLDENSVEVDLSNIGLGNSVPLVHDGNGTYSTAMLALGNINTVSEGLHTVTLTAMDTSGYRANASLTIEVSDRPIITDYYYRSRDPSTGNMVRNTNPVAWGQDFDVWCTVLDPSGTTSSVRADMSGLDLSASVNLLDADFDDDYNSTIRSMPGSVPEGPHGVPITVTDAGGSSTTVNLIISVIDSNAPVFTNVWKEVWTGTQFQKTVGPVDWDDNLWIYATINDPDRDLLNHSVYLNTQTLGLGTLMMNETSLGTYAVNITIPVSAAEGAHTLVLNATDASGHTANVVYSLEVSRAPFISDAWVYDIDAGERTTSEIPRGGDILVGANVTDTNGDLNVNSVYLDVPSMGINMQMAQDPVDAKRFETASFAIPMTASEGIHIGMINATDLTGKTDSTTVIIKVGSGPRITEVWYSVWNGTAFERTKNPLYWGEQFILYGRISDPDNNLDETLTNVDVSSLALGTQGLSDADSDGIFNTAVLTLPGQNRVSTGPHEVYYTAFDLESNGVTREMTIKVNAGPRISNIGHAVWTGAVWSNATESVQNGEYFMLFADVSDPDFNLDENLVFADISQVNSSAGFVQMTEMPSQTGRFRTSPVQVQDSTTAGVHRLTLNATDENGVENTAEYLLRIGSGPVISDSWYETGAPMERTNDPIPWGSQFRIHAYITDPDNDLDDSSVRVDLRSLGLNWTQMFDTTGDNEYNTSVQLMPGENVVSEGAHVVTVEAYDETGKADYSRITVLISSGPVFKDKWIEADVLGNFTRTTDPLAWGEDYYINAVVYDPDFDLDVSSIYVDLSSIGGSSTESLSTVLGNNTYQTNLLTIGPASQVSEGIHILPLFASDDAGNTASTEIIITISEAPVIRHINYSSGPTNATLVWNENPIPWNYQFAIGSLITDPDNDLDLSSVYVDLSQLSLSSHANMTHVGSGYFLSENMTMPGMSTVPSGTYKITVHAMDADGHAVSASRTITVNSGPIISRIYYESPNADAGWDVNTNPIGWGQNFILYTDIADPYATLDETSVVADMRELGLGWVSMNQMGFINTFATANLTMPSSNVVSEGAHQITVYAEDDQGTNVSKEKTIVVSSGPVIRELSYSSFYLDASGNYTWGVNSEPMGWGDNFTIHAYITDPDDDLLNHSVYADLTAFDGGYVPLHEEAPGTNNFTSDNFTIPVGSADRDYILVVNATDSLGSTTRDDLVIQIRQNPVIRDPHYESYYLNATGNQTWGRNASPLSWGDNFTLHATITDPDFDLDATSCFVDLSSLGLGDESLNLTEGNSFETANITMPNNLYQTSYPVVFHAFDLSGNEGTGTINLYINAGPVVQSTWYQRNNTIYSWATSIAWGENFTVHATITDPDGNLDVDSVEADLSDIDGLGIEPMTLVNGSMVEFATDNITMPVNLDRTEFTATLRASDLTNATSTYEFTISVNPGPRVEDIWHQSNFSATGNFATNTNPVPPGEDYRIQARITDPDYNLNHSSARCDLSSISAGLVVNMTYVGNGVFETDVLAMPAGTTEGIYSIRVNVSDLTGYNGTGSYDLVVAETFSVPVVFATVDPSATTGGQPVKIKAYATDGEQLDQKVDYVEYELGATWGGGTGLMTETTQGLFIASVNVPNPSTDTLYFSTVRSYNSAGVLLAQDNASVYVVYDNTGNNSGAGGYPGGLPTYYSYISYRQSFEIFRGDADEPDFDDDTRIFVQGEYMYIRVASTTMDNVNQINELIITNKTSGQVVGSPPIDDPPFEFQQVIGDYSEYQARVHTETMGLGGYSVFVRLKDDDSSHQIFTAYDDITITDINGWAPASPVIRTYSDDTYATRDNDFNATDMIYIEMEVMDTDVNPDADLVLIQDYYGGTQVSGAPSTIMPNGGIYISPISVSGVTYRIEVDLRYAAQDPWNRGKSSYTLTVQNLIDGNEGPYDLSMQINVTSPRSRLDFVMGTTGIGTGNANFAHYDYIFHTINNNFMTTHILEALDETPGGGQSASQVVYATEFADLDRDADLDVLASLEAQGGGFQLAWYENRLTDGGTWENKVEINRYGDTSRIIAITAGDVNGDGNNDWAIATDNGNLNLYINSYMTPMTQLDTGNFIELKSADLDNDGNSEIVGLSNGNVYVYNKDGILFDLNLAGVTDFDLGDIDGDGIIDIATIGANGIRKHIVSVSVQEFKYIASGAGDGTAAGIANSMSSDNNHMTITEASEATAGSVSDHYVTSFSFDPHGESSDDLADVQADDGIYYGISEVDDGSNPASTTVETRYMRNDGILGTAATAGVASVNTGKITSADTAVYTGIQVYVNMVDPANEITGGSAEAVVKRDANGAGIQQATFFCPETTIQPTDTIWVVVLQDVGINPPETVRNTWETPVLGSNILDNTGWQVYYHTERGPQGNGFYGVFSWGDGVNFNSRIEGFSHTQQNPNYRMDCEATIGGVPAGDAYDLELEYHANGESFDMEIYDSSTGAYNYVTTFNNGVMGIFNTAISDAEWNSGNVRVRFVDVTQVGDGTQNYLEIDYMRVTVTIDPANTYVMDWIGRVTNNPAGNAQSLVIEGYTQDEVFRVTYSDAAAGPWTLVGTINWTTDSSFSIAINPLIEGEIYLRFEDLDRTGSDLTQSTLYLDYVTVRTTTDSGIGDVQVSPDNTWDCIGIGNADDAGSSDFVVGIDGQVASYDGDAGVQLWSSGAGLGKIQFKNPDHASHAFSGEDVNGDGYVDIVVSGTTVAAEASGLYVWYNLGPGEGFWDHLVKDLYTDVTAGANDPGDIYAISLGDTLGS